MKNLLSTEDFVGLSKDFAYSIEEEFKPNDLHKSIGEFAFEVTLHKEAIIKSVMLEYLGRELDLVDCREITLIKHPYSAGFLEVLEFVYKDIVLGQIIVTKTEVFFKPHEPVTTVTISDGCVTNFTMAPTAKFKDFETCDVMLGVDYKL